MPFFHGIQLVQSVADALKVTDVPSDVIVLIGTAPAGPENVLTLVRNRTEAKQFGAQRAGFSIPQSLEDIFTAAKGETRVLVINPFVRSSMGVAVTAEALTLVGGKGTLAFPYVGTVLVKDTTGVTTYLKDTDYTLDAFGNLTSIKNSTIAATAPLKITYTKPDFSLVTSTVINGTVDGTTRARTGLELVYTAFNKFGFDPAIIIAPGFMVAAVQAKVLEINNELGSVAIVDCPVGTTVPTMLTSRGSEGTINFYQYDKSFILVGPHVYGYDPKVNGDALRNPAPFVAGLIADNDRQFGFAKSPSNIIVNGVNGTQVDITGSPFRTSGDMQDLNALGISTFVSVNGLRLFGNRNASYNYNTQSNNAADSFISVYRTLRLLGKAVQLSALAYLDQKGTEAFITQVEAAGQTYINTLIGRGDLLPGSICYFDREASDVVSGIYQFVLNVMPPTPAERIIFNVRMDQSIATTLFAA